MHLANDASLISERVEDERCRFYVLKGLEVAPSLLEAVLPILMGVQSSVDSRPAAAARSRAGKGIREPGSLSGEIINMGCLDGAEAVAAKHEAQVISDHQEHVSLFFRGHDSQV